MNSMCNWGGALATLRDIENLKIGDGIGTVYGGTFPDKSVSSSADTEIARIELPAGVYIAIGYSEINIDSNRIYLLKIDGHPRIRCSGTAGGGTCISAIVVMKEPGVIKFSMLATESGIKSHNVEFQAVKIANIKEENT